MGTAGRMRSRRSRARLARPLLSRNESFAPRETRNLRHGKQHRATSSVFLLFFPGIPVPFTSSPGYDPLNVPSHRAACDVASFRGKYSAELLRAIAWSYTEQEECKGWILNYIFACCELVYLSNRKLPILLSIMFPLIINCVCLLYRSLCNLKTIATHRLRNLHSPSLPHLSSPFIIDPLLISLQLISMAYLKLSLPPFF